MNERSSVLEPGENLLLAGMVSLLVSAWLGAQVMLGLLAFFTAPLALVLMFIGIVRGRDRSLSVGRQTAGFMLLVVALAGLFTGSVAAAEVSAKRARLAQIREEKMRSQLASAQSTRPGTPAVIPPEIHAQVEAEVQELATKPFYATKRVHWTVEIGSRLAPLFMGLGLFCWAGWSLVRCLVWAGVILLIFPGIGLFFHVLGPWMVFSA